MTFISAMEYLTYIVYDPVMFTIVESGRVPTIPTCGHYLWDCSLEYIYLYLYNIIPARNKFYSF